MRFFVSFWDKIGTIFIRAKTDHITYSIKIGTNSLKKKKKRLVGSSSSTTLRSCWIVKADQRTTPVKSFSDSEESKEKGCNPFIIKDYQYNYSKFLLCFFYFLVSISSIVENHWKQLV